MIPDLRVIDIITATRTRLNILSGHAYTQIPAYVRLFKQTLNSVQQTKANLSIIA